MTAREGCEKPAWFSTCSTCNIDENVRNGYCRFSSNGWAPTTHYLTRIYCYTGISKVFSGSFNNLTYWIIRTFLLVPMKFKLPSFYCTVPRMTPLLGALMAMWEGYFALFSSENRAPLASIQPDKLTVVQAVLDFFARLFNDLNIRIIRTFFSSPMMFKLKSFYCTTVFHTMTVIRIVFVHFLSRPATASCEAALWGNKIFCRTSNFLWWKNLKPTSSEQRIHNTMQKRWHKINVYF